MKLYRTARMNPMNRYPHPLKLLTVGLVLSVIILPVVGWIVWSMYDSLSKVAGHEFKLQRLVGTIAHLNEVLTMSARMAAATGDSSWEAHYRTVEPKLDDALAETAILSRREYEKNYASQTKLAYTKLIEMEYLAFALVRKGRPDEAVTILFSPEYTIQKDLYSQSLARMTEAVETRISGEIRTFRRRMLSAAVLGLVGLTVLLSAWFGVSLLVRQDLQRRRRAEKALFHEKERLAVTLRSIGDGVITSDTDGKVIMMNPVAESLTGWAESDALGKPLDDVFVIVNERSRQRCENPVSRVLATGTICGLANHTVLIARDGTQRAIADSGAPLKDEAGNVIGVVLVFRDVTERQNMEDELLKAEKLESLGLLAGGLAHDFNNILTAILGNVSLLRLELDGNGKPNELLAAAEKAAFRAKDLTDQLLTFARGGAPIKEVSSIAELLVDWTTFPLRGSNVNCRFKVDPDLWQLEIDLGQISRVVNNLIINADQAMPGGGTVYVSARNLVVAENSALPLASGRYVRITVRDEGMGMSPIHLQKIFDPYFTTKEKGTGLGLTTSYSVVKRHNGHIAAASQPGVGTTFDVYLPAADHEADFLGDTPVTLRKGKGRVLVMDDEQLVRDLASELLRFLGYSVGLSRDGREAMELYLESKRRGRPFDAVIMDLTIPGGMGGREAIGRLRDLDPHVKAIVSSGYCNDPVMSDFRKHGFSGVLCKPYNAEEMSRILDMVINSHQN